LNFLTKARVESVTNQRFARAENLISRYLPVFEPELFGRQGKVMDSWESARHNPSLCDSVVLGLDKPHAARFISLSTKYHDGNQAQFVRVLGRKQDQDWQEILAVTPMEGHSYLNIKLNEPTPEFSSVKIEMYPDGGLSRAGLYETLPESEGSHFEKQGAAKCRRYEDVIPKTKKPLSLNYAVTPEKIKRNKEIYSKLKKPVNLAGLAFGAEIVEASNEHYGPAVQVISPFPPIHMFDGLESARSREKGHSEHVTIKLAENSVIKKIILDFQYFVNNNPKEVSIQGLSENGQWKNLVSPTNVKAFASNKKEFKISDSGRFSQLKLTTLPDGGINRIEVF
jgi:allantoicase